MVNRRAFLQSAAALGALPALTIPPFVRDANGLEEWFANAGEASLRSQLYLSMANDTERAVLANALVRLLEAGVRLSHDQSDGYVTDSNSEWLWIDFQDGQVFASHPPTIEVENALLRYDVARRTLASGISTRMHTSPPDLRPIPIH